MGKVNGSENGGSLTGNPHDGSLAEDSQSGSRVVNAHGENQTENTHGGNIYEVSAQYGIKPEELTDFSANINPLGMSRMMRELLLEGLESLLNYPDTQCIELRKEISIYLGVPQDCILAGNGASEIISLIFAVLRPRKLLLPAPCFSEYESAAYSTGTEILYYRLREEDEFRLDTDDFIREIPQGTDAIILCNPNNPTSKRIPREDMKKLLEYSFARNIMIIVDEAFIELTEGGNENSIVNSLEQYSNLIIIRSLTKILAIPGLRLGYALGERSVIREMWQKKSKWSVNSLACKIGRVLNADHAYFAATADWISSEKERIYNNLAGIEGLKVYKPDTNFILLKILDKRHTSESLRDQLIQKGFITRDASNFKFLDNTFIRVAVKDKASNDRLLTALSEALA